MEEKEKKFQKLFFGLFTLGFIVICLVSVLFLFLYFKGDKLDETVESEVEDSNQLEYDSVIAESDMIVSTIDPVDIAGSENLEILENELIPIRDPLELAVRLKGISTPRVSLSEPPQVYDNGAIKPFWVLNVDENEYREVEATLAFQTDHLYFWIENGIEYNPDSVALLAMTFESSIYPINRSLFGSEWTPGVDNDEHLVIIFAERLGGAAGYFSGTDSFTPEVKTYSNQAEMFYLSADYLNLGNSYTYGVLAHEFQHMIHWYQDRNETSWLNEGLSELAVDLNGYNTGGFMYQFAFDPDLQLTFWPGDDQGDSSANYGSSFLFTRYLYSQFGRQFIAEIVNSPENGLTSIDESLEEYKNVLDADGSISLGDQVFQNWTIANYLQDTEIENGVFGYGDFQNLPPFFSTEEIDCGSDWVERTVSQYGTDYIELNCSGDFQIEFEADRTVDLLSVDPYSGGHYFWSNYGDESNMRLYREFDFTGITGPISMNYWTWFDIERDYDYVYVTASTNADEWIILDSPSCTTEDPTGANYGCGYNGLSGGWISETVDLSAFAGEKVTIQFEYITDAAVNGEGLVIDDISIDALGYFTDFEEDEGGWQGEGFVHISNQLPQSYATSSIQIGDDTLVEKWVSVSGLQPTIQVENVKDQDEIILAISGLTRYTRLPAKYRFRIRQIDLPARPVYIFQFQLRVQLFFLLRLPAFVRVDTAVFPRLPDVCFLRFPVSTAGWSGFRQ